MFFWKYCYPFFFSQNVLHRTSILRPISEAIVRRCFVKKIFLETSQHSLQNTFSCAKTLWHRCFPVNFTKSLRARFLLQHLRDCFCNLCINLLLNCWCVFSGTFFMSDLNLLIPKLESLHTHLLSIKQLLELRLPWTATGLRWISDKP